MSYIDYPTTPGQPNLSKSVIEKRILFLSNDYEPHTLYSLLFSIYNLKD